MVSKNLIPFNKLTEEEQRKLASSGGKKSVEVRKKKRDLKERFKIALEFMAKERLLKKQVRLIKLN